MDTKKTVISTEVEMHIFTVYSSEFTSKEGKKIRFFKAIVNAFPGCIEIPITEALFNELQNVGSGISTVLFLYDYKFGKVKLDSIG